MYIVRSNIDMVRTNTGSSAEAKVLRYFLHSAEIHEFARDGMKMKIRLK